MVASRGAPWTCQLGCVPLLRPFKCALPEAVALALVEVTSVEGSVLFSLRLNKSQMKFGKPQSAGDSSMHVSLSRASWVYYLAGVPSRRSSVCVIPVMVDSGAEAFTEKGTAKLEGEGTGSELGRFVMGRAPTAASPSVDAPRMRRPGTTNLL